MNGQGRKPVKIDLQSLAERKVHYTFMYCIIVLYAKENTLLLLLLRPARGVLKIAWQA